VDTGISIDLSKATKLRDLRFRCRVRNVRWIIATLQTVETKNLQQIAIRLHIAGPRDSTEGADYQALDRMLVQFWFSHLIRPRFLYILDDGGKTVRDQVSHLFPELTRKGLVDMVKTAPIFVTRGYH